MIVLRDQLIRKIIAALPRHAASDDTWCVAAYNDAPKRKHSEILNWIKRAARQNGVTPPNI